MARNHKNQRAYLRLSTIYTFIALLMIIFSGWYALRLVKNIYAQMLPGKSEKNGIVVVFNPESQNPQLKLDRSAGHIREKGFMDKVREQFYCWQIKRETEASYEQALKIYNEKKTAAMLKKFAAAQKAYKAHYGLYARRATELIIKDGEDLKIIDPDLRAINYSYDRTRPACGYYFKYLDRDDKAVANGQGVGFSLCAVPAEYGKLADNTLVIDTRGIVYKKDTRGRPIRDIKELDKSWVEF